MPASVTITVQSIGSKKPLVPDWSVPIPPQQYSGGEPLTLRDLITRIVVDQVEQFRDRQQNRRHLRLLTGADIERGLAAGKIEMGGSSLSQIVDEEAAIGSALQAFEDGLYLVFIDEKQMKSLDEPVLLSQGTRVLFIRLTFLAGA